MLKPLSALTKRYKFLFSPSGISTGMVSSRHVLCLKNIIKVCSSEFSKNSVNY